jgi:hypothetical protein
LAVNSKTFGESTSTIQTCNTTKIKPCWACTGVAANVVKNISVICVSDTSKKHNFVVLEKNGLTRAADYIN